MENYHFHWEPPLRFGLLNCLPPKETNHTNHHATNKITLGHGKRLQNYYFDRDFDSKLMKN